MRDRARLGLRFGAGMLGAIALAGCSGVPRAVVRTTPRSAGATSTTVARSAGTTTTTLPASLSGLEHALLGAAQLPAGFTPGAVRASAASPTPAASGGPGACAAAIADAVSGTASLAVTFTGQDQSHVVESLWKLPSAPAASAFVSQITTALNGCPAQGTTNASGAAFLVTPLGLPGSVPGSSAYAVTLHAGTQTRASALVVGNKGEVAWAVIDSPREVSPDSGQLAQLATAADAKLPG